MRKLFGNTETDVVYRNTQIKNISKIKRSENPELYERCMTHQKKKTIL